MSVFPFFFFFISLTGLFFLEFFDSWCIIPADHLHPNQTRQTFKFKYVFRSSSCLRTNKTQAGMQANGPEINKNRGRKINYYRILRNKINISCSFFKKKSLWFPPHFFSLFFQSLFSAHCSLLWKRLRRNLFCLLCWCKSQNKWNSEFKKCSS